MTTKANTNPNKIARIAGFLYIIPWLFSLLAIFLRQGLITPGDVSATADNLTASESLFRLSIVSDLVVQAVFVVLVLLLYQLLKPVNKSHAVLMVVFFLVSVPIAMLNMLNQFAALLLISGADYLSVFSTDQLGALVVLFRDLHEVGIMIAYIFWGLWLFPLGYLVYKSGFLPKLLGILLMVSCFGYLIDFSTFFLFPNFGLAVNMFTGWAELLLCLWLLIKGVNVEKWEERTLKIT